VFVRLKSKGPYRYLQLVENHREGFRTVQRVLCTPGRVEELMAQGAPDALLRSLARHTQHVQVVDGNRNGGCGAKSLAAPQILVRNPPFSRPNCR